MSAIMKSVNLQPDNQSQLLVLPLGFDAAVIEKLKGIFQLANPSHRHYVVTTTPTKAIDILLVNYDNAAAVKQKETLLAQTCPSAPVVALSHGLLPQPPLYHIRGILTVARLLGLLDTVEISAPSNPIVKEPPIVKEQPTASIIPINIAAESAKQGAGYRALIVDDSLAIQKSIELKLQQLPQITVIDFADDGEQALAKAASNQYDLIFLDVMMPGIDGYQTCTELRKTAAYKKTPIIMVSGKSSPLDEVKGVIAGCTTYLIKPIQEEAFHKLSVRVLTWLAEQRKASEALMS
jgi:CheY-like chemotaxis protein